MRRSARSTCLALLILSCGLSAVSAIQSVPQSSPDEAAAATSDARIKQRDQLAETLPQLLAEGDSAKTLEILQQILQLETDAFGKTNLELTGTLQMISQEHLKLQQIEQARAAAQQMLDIHTAANGQDHPDTVMARWRVDFLDKLAAAPKNIQEQIASDTAKADQLFQSGRILESAQALLNRAKLEQELAGRDHPHLIETWQYLAVCFDTAKNYRLMEKAATRAVSIARKSLGDEHPTMAFAAYRYAVSLIRQGAPHAIDAMEPLEHARKVFVKQGRVDLTANLDDWRGQALALQERNREAIEAYQSALDGFRKIPGNHDMEIATTLNNLGFVYKSIGDLPNAAEQYQGAIAQTRKAVGEKHPSYATALSNLGGVYLALRNGEEAERLCQQSLDILVGLYGADDPRCAANYGNLALVCFELGDYPKAETLFLKSQQLLKASVKADDPRLAFASNGLSQIYVKQGKLPDALQMATEAMEIRRQSVGEKHPDFAASLSQLASVNASLRELQKSELLYRQALQIDTDARGADHPMTLITADNLAGALRKNGKSAEAFDLHVDVVQRTLDWMTRVSPLQTELQQLEYTRKLRLRIDPLISLTIDASLDPNPTIAAVMEWKGINLLRWRSKREPVVSEGTASRTKFDLQTLQSSIPPGVVLVDFLTYLHSAPSEESELMCFSHRLIATILRNDGPPVLLNLGGLREINDAIDTWRAGLTVTDSQPADAAGLLLRRRLWEPIIPHLKAGDTILISADGELGKLPFNALPGSGPGTYLLEEHRIAMLAVPRLLPELSEKSEQEPQGGLLLVGGVDYDAGVSSEAIPGNPGTESELAELSLLRSDAGGSFQPLLETLPEVKAIQEQYSLAFPDADSDSVRLLSNAEATESALRELAGNYKVLHIATHGRFTNPVKLLPQVGTGISIQPADQGALITAVAPDCDTPADQRPRINDLLLAIAEGDEEFVSLEGFPVEEIRARLKGSPLSPVRLKVLPPGSDTPVIHNLFRQPRLKEGPVINSDLLSCLALAGANGNSKALPVDGLFTTADAAALQLKGTDLVVLSACETGLGTAASGEGLLGLQRAFQVAGARTTISTLWNVDDAATRQLMVRFYQNLWGEQKKSRLDALRDAQLFLLNHPESITLSSGDRQGGRRPPIVVTTKSGNGPARTSPYYWAAPVLSGDWR